jgi:iron complex outermembrane receptor protein
MRWGNTCSALAIVAAAMVPGQLMAQDSVVADVEAIEDPGDPDADDTQLDTIVVTAQRREASVQDTSAAISAFSGAALEESRTLSFEDLAGQATSLSFTALSPLDQEFNIRGITNTRLDSPSADQSVGIFVDDVYVGRSGLFNFDLYDVDRVEVVRGPQGVLLGKNVVGGAISIYSARPEPFFGGSVTASYGNYNEKLVRGHITGPISDSVAARLAFQVRNRDGFNYDIAHQVDLDNVDSVQMRGQIGFEPVDSQFSAVLIADYTRDQSNGFHSVVVDGPAPGAGPWSTARELVADLRPEGLDIRESLPDYQTYKGDVYPTPQQLEREAFGLALNMSYDFDFATLTSITGYRSGEAYSVYDQTGIGPSNEFGVIVPLLFRSPVREREDISQFTQEVRLVSPEQDVSGFEYILGGYYQHDEVSKDDIISFEIRVPVIPTLNGQSAWFNEGTNQSYAVFGQLGYRFSEQFRVVGGVRYSKDEKSGTVQGLALETGDKFTPNDPVPSSPLSPTYVEGGGYTTDYSNTWEEVTPQVTAEFQPNPDILIYATYSSGFKGGGFEDDPANPTAAQSSYDPETVDSFELGGKFEFLDRRARLNLAAFSMRYKDLQVTQTSDACLCNITDNAADAKIMGIEAEATLLPFAGFVLTGGLTLLDTEYIEFTDSVGNVNDGKFNVTGRYTTDLGSWTDGFSASLSYSEQGSMSWNPEGSANEPGYGLLDGRISISPTPDLTFSIWGRNLTDELYRTNAIAFFGDEASRLGAPRTYGAEVSVNF